MTVRTNRGSGTGTWFGRALAVGVLFAVGGCAPATRPPRAGYAALNLAARDHFKIIFPNGSSCPDDVTASGRACPNPKPGHACLAVTGGQKVVFVAVPQTNPNTDQANEFVLQFDPFGKTSVESSGGVVDELTLRHSVPNKLYTFIVKGSASANCPTVIDPQLILD